MAEDWPAVVAGRGCAGNPGYRVLCRPRPKSCRQCNNQTEVAATFPIQLLRNSRNRSGKQPVCSENVVIPDALRRPLLSSRSRVGDDRPRPWRAVAAGPPDLTRDNPSIASRPTIWAPRAFAGMDLHEARELLREPPGPDHDGQPPDPRHPRRGRIPRRMA